MNLKTIIRWKHIILGFFDYWIEECSTAVWCRLTGNVVDDGWKFAVTPPQPSEKCTPLTPRLAEIFDDPEENTDTQNGITLQQWGDIAAAAASTYFRYYVGALLHIVAVSLLPQTFPTRQFLM